MKLLSLEPEWVNAPPSMPPARGLGVIFLCPCGSGARRFVPFLNALEGEVSQKGWQRTGDEFANLTLSPSIWFRSGCCTWHGWIRDGEVTEA